MATDSASDAQTTALLRTLITALEDKKAENLMVLSVGGVSDITDYLVLATGNSEPHLRALRIETEKVFDAAKAKIAGMDSGGFNSGWTVVDAYQIMVHFFTAEQRETYSLEKLWKDAATVDLQALLAKPAIKAKGASKRGEGKVGKGKAVGAAKRKGDEGKKAEEVKDAGRGTVAKPRKKAATKANKV